MIKIVLLLTEKKEKKKKITRITLIAAYRQECQKCALTNDKDTVEKLNTELKLFPCKSR